MSISHTVNTAERKLRLVLSFVNSVPVSLSCLTLCNPTDCSPPVSLLCVHGIFQARILEWVAIFSSRGSSRPRDQTQVSSTANRGPWTGLKYLLPIHHETKRFCQHINNLYQKQPGASSRIFFFFFLQWNVLVEARSTVIHIVTQIFYLLSRITVRIWQCCYKDGIPKIQGLNRKIFLTHITIWKMGRQSRRVRQLCSTWLSRAPVWQVFNIYTVSTSESKARGAVVAILQLAVSRKGEI